MCRLVQPNLDTVCSLLGNILFRSCVRLFQSTPPYVPALWNSVKLRQFRGLPTTDSFNLTIGQYAMAGVATILSMGVLERVGRRKLWLAGLAGMFVPVACIGVLSLVPRQTPGVVWPQGVLVLVRFFAYGISCGPIPFVFCGEVGSVRLRQKVGGTKPFNPTAPSARLNMLITWCLRHLPCHEMRSTLLTSSLLACRRISPIPPQQT